MNRIGNNAAKKMKVLCIITGAATGKHNNTQDKFFLCILCVA